MRRVLCVLDLRDNLLSVGGLVDDRHTVMFTKKACTALYGTTIVGRGGRKGSIYVLGITKQSGTGRSMAAEDGSAKRLNLCRARFGHADLRVIKYMTGKIWSVG